MAASMRLVSAEASSSTAKAPAAPSSCGCDPPADSYGTVKNPQDGPSQADIDACAELPILDVNGKSHPFKSLYTGSDRASQQLIIFVRHFFCGNCQDYIRAVSHAITPDALSQLSPPAAITIISCGDPSLIPKYTAATSCPYPIFTDPTRKIYETLGMIRTLDLGPTTPSYMQSSLLGVVVGSFWQALSSGRSALKGGDFSQVGGEVVVRNGKVVWGRRMRNTRDHAEIAELRRVLGLSGDAEERVRRSSSIRDVVRRSSSWARRSSAGRGSRRSSSGSPLRKKQAEAEPVSKGDGTILNRRAAPTGIGAEL